MAESVHSTCYLRPLALLAVLARALVLAAAVLWQVGASAAATPEVAIVLSSKIPPFEQAAAAIVATLAHAPVQPEILTFDLQGTQDNAAAVLALVHRAKPALVVTVGSLATAAVLADSWSAPIVFSMVLYPEQSGFVPGSSREVTGASLDLPLDLQFRTLRQLLPEARRLGVLYHDAETGRIVSLARTVAPRHGFTLEAREVGQPGETLAALATLLGNVDAVWTVADSQVLTLQTTSAVILEALRARVPLFGLSAAHVRTGALAALSCDYADVGAQAGELALRVLRGDHAADIPPTSPRRVSLTLNLRTAQHLGVKIGPDLEREAAEVIR